MTNPYQAPRESSGISASVQAPALPLARITLSLLLLVSSVIVLLLLNGQHFTNALISIALIVISLLLWLSVIPNQRWRKLALCILAVHIAILFAATRQLPERYLEQKLFNAESDKNDSGAF